MKDEIDYEHLKSQAERCIQDIQKANANPGPAAKRFCQELYQLLTNIQQSKDQCHSTTSEIETVQHRMQVQVEDTDRMSQSLEMSQKKIQDLESDVDGYMLAIKDVETSTNWMKSEVRFRVY
jgi:chromosome segregation ATPase